jgi:hypothetical protein
VENEKRIAINEIPAIILFMACLRYGRSVYSMAFIQDLMLLLHISYTRSVAIHRGHHTTGTELPVTGDNLCINTMCLHYFLQGIVPYCYQ